MNLSPCILSEYLLRHNLCCSYLNCIRHKINIITLLTSNAFNDITEITDITNIIEIMRITDTMYIAIHALQILPILLKLPVLLKLPILLKLSVLLIYITLPALLIILILLKWPVILTMSMLKKIPASLILLIFLHLPTLLALPILLKSTTLLKLPTSLKLPKLLTFTNDIQTWRHSYKVFLSCSETSHMSICCAWKSHAGFFHVHGNIAGTCHFDWVLNIIVLENFWQRLLIFVELYYTLFESFYYIHLLFFHLFILGMFKISSPNCVNRTKTFILFCHFLSNMCILLSFFSIEIYTTVITWNLVTFSSRNWIVYHFIRPYKIFTFNISWMFSFLQNGSFKRQRVCSYKKISRSKCLYEVR